MKYNFTGQTSPLPFLLWTLHIIRETQQKPWFVQYTKDLFVRNQAILTIKWGIKEGPKFQKKKKKKKKRWKEQ